MIVVLPVIFPDCINASVLALIVFYIPIQPPIRRLAVQDVFGCLMDRPFEFSKVENPIWFDFSFYGWVLFEINYFARFDVPSFQQSGERNPGGEALFISDIKCFRAEFFNPDPVYSLLRYRHISRVALDAYPIAVQDLCGCPGRASSKERIKDHIPRIG